MSDLPPYLRNTEPMEPEAIPLQVALLTMELAALRHRLAVLEMALMETTRTGTRAELERIEHVRNHSD